MNKLKNKTRKYLNRLFKQKNKSGFTLIEMLIVLVVVALLMAIIIPNIAGQRDRINVQATQNIADIVSNQVETYDLIEGTNSVSLQTLLDEEYLTLRQVEEAVKLLDLDQTTDIVLPIEIPSETP